MKVWIGNLSTWECFIYFVEKRFAFLCLIPFLVIFTFLFVTSLNKNKTVTGSLPEIKQSIVKNKKIPEIEIKEYSPSIKSDSGLIASLGLFFMGMGALSLILCFVMYFLPCLIAQIRNHPNLSYIVLLNLFLGWTFFGWIAALIWAFIGKDWRSDPISDKQMEYLVDLGVNKLEVLNLTKGQASKMIDKLKAAR